MCIFVTQSRRFNRLKEDQLSAVSQQIQVIQAAIKEHTPSVTLLGKVIDVNFNAGVCIEKDTTR